MNKKSLKKINKKFLFDQIEEVFLSIQNFHLWMNVASKMWKQA